CGQEFAKIPVNAPPQIVPVKSHRRLRKPFLAGPGQVKRGARTLSAGCSITRLRSTVATTSNTVWQISASPRPRLLNGKEYEAGASPSMSVNTAFERSRSERKRAIGILARFKCK